MPSQGFRELLGLQKPTVYRAVRDEIKAYPKEHGIQTGRGQLMPIGVD